MSPERRLACWKALERIRIGLRLHTGLKPHASTRHRIRGGLQTALINARALVAALEAEELAWQRGDRA